MDMYAPKATMPANPSRAREMVHHPSTRPSLSTRLSNMVKVAAYVSGSYCYSTHATTSDWTDGLQVY